MNRVAYARSLYAWSVTLARGVNLACLLTLQARQAEERYGFDDLASQLQALGAEHAALQASHVALVESASAAERGAAEQLQMRDHLVHALGAQVSRGEE